ncbi:hypothetical protein SAMN05444369_11182 [Capnocytophaga haemolytica]|uniref:C4-dicarboxylate ABC transporter n=1 Tax=Capnocytophaga haemolytica TaxID=45243 RepID=A0AAX2H2N6_9FLAO|nr:hypothetical protein [Capnocytophaga haemolytica]SFO16624.1 hypothetical protein SAMN05444369_11182 [Capnocytophaga haemolytica]SNV14680.1 Uncharacterised protein [Capnocytophaga haemolytica]
MNYILMILGVAIALSRYWFKQYDQLLLTVGVVLLMVGVYRISRGLPPKEESNE